MVYYVHSTNQYVSFRWTKNTGKYKESFMTDGVFTVDVIAEAFDASHSAVHRKVRDMFPEIIGRGRAKTRLNGRQAGAVILELAGERVDTDVFERMMKRLDLICDAVSPGDKETLEFDESPGAINYIPQDLNIEPDNVGPVVFEEMPEKINPDTRMTAKQFTIHTGIKIDRQILGVYASRVAHANRISVERKEIAGISHPVSLWPLNVWNTANKILTAKGISGDMVKP